MTQQTLLYVHIVVEVVSSHRLFGNCLFSACRCWCALHIHFQQIIVVLVHSSIDFYFSEHSYLWCSNEGWLCCWTWLMMAVHVLLFFIPYDNMWLLPTGAYHRWLKCHILKTLYILYLNDICDIFTTLSELDTHTPLKSPGEYCASC